MSKNHGYELGVLLGVTFGLQSKAMMAVGKNGYFGDDKSKKRTFYEKPDRETQLEENALDIIYNQKSVYLSRLSVFSKKYIYPMSTSQRIELLKDWKKKGLVQYQEIDNGRGTIIVTWSGGDRQCNNYKRHGRDEKQVIIDFLRRKQVVSIGKLSSDCAAMKKLSHDDRAAMINTLVSEKIIDIVKQKNTIRTVTFIKYVGA